MTPHRSSGMASTGLPWLLLVLPCTLVVPAAAQGRPAGGLWSLDMTLDGAPGRATPRTGQVCLPDAPLAEAPEQTLIDAATRLGPSGSPVPSACAMRDLQRSGGRSAWQVQCDGPMGRMQGTGQAVWSADAAELKQAFAVKAPLGSLTLQQTVTARRQGAC